MNEQYALRPVVGLTRGLPEADLETLTVEAIRTHRKLLEKAEQLYEAMPDEFKYGRSVGGSQHIAYLEASFELYGQMDVLSTLLDLLGRIPEVPVH